ncbi:hypothetical protein JTB14_017362 [Gonioctena quinquepunctata]|nr:hypothetical protein JTB14_017362 [Gonioctena quinquepunctata]
MGPRSVLTSIYISIFLILGFAWSGTSGSIVDPDPLTGLTARDRDLVKNSFNAMRNTPRKYGKAILVTFFLHNRSAQKLFPYRDIPIDSLVSNPQFEKHSLTVQDVIASIIDSLDNSPRMIALLGKVAEQLVSLGATESLLFTQFQESMIDYLSPRMNAEEVGAWKKILKVAFDVMRGVVREKNTGK